MVAGSSSSSPSSSWSDSTPALARCSSSRFYLACAFNAAASFDARALVLLMDNVRRFVWLKNAGSYDKVDDKMACENDRGAGTMFSSWSPMFCAASSTEADVDPDEEMGA